MNANIVRNRPSEMTKEEFIKSWENIGYTLSALYKTLQENKSNLTKVKGDDFDCPNHYAKLAYQAGQLDQLEFILSILPSSSKF